MSRDMKPKKTAPKKKSGGGTLLGMFIGLVLGVMIAAGVVWYMNKTPVPFVTKVQPPPPGTAPAAPNGAAPQAAAPAPQPMALPGKPGDPVPEKRFQFYDILQGKTEAVPGKGDAKPAAEAKPQEQEAKKEEPKKDEKAGKPHYLQAGSFSKAQDADNLKANLAMMGLEATVQQVMVQDKTFYRLRLGPYTKVEEANKVRAELAKSGVETAVVSKE